CPASPSPTNRMRVPSSTPAGNLTLILRLMRTRLLPLHFVQGEGRTSPVPLHVGQVEAVITEPKRGLCWRRRISPCPLQVEQVTGEVGGSAPLPLQRSQTSKRGMSRSRSVP